MDSLETAVQAFQMELSRNGAAQDYLLGRGLDAQTASMYRLGAATSIPAFESYAGRLAIPYLTPRGAIDIRFRSLDLSQPKYLSRSGGAMHMYNVLAFKKDADFIAVCEGEIDTITCDALCGIPAVGMPGVNAWKPYWHRAFADYRRVFVFCDGDEPGREMGKRVQQTVEQATVVHLPDGEDVNSLFLKGGPDEIRRRVGL